jgi:hypothetical protein
MRHRRDFGERQRAESPLRVYCPGSNLSEHRLLELTAGRKLINAGGVGDCAGSDRRWLDRWYMPCSRQRSVGGLAQAIRAEMYV